MRWCRPARQTSRGSRSRLLSLGRDAAFGLGVRGLPQGLPQRDRRARRRAPDPAPRHAALAGRPAWTRSWSTWSRSPTTRATRPRAAPGGSAPTWIRPHRRHPGHRLHAYLTSSSSASTARRRHQSRLPRPGRLDRSGRQSRSSRKPECPSTSPSTTSRDYRYDRPVDARPARRPPAACAALPHADPDATRSRSSPSEHFLNWQQDPLQQLPRPARLPEADARVRRVEVDLVAEMAVINPFDFFLEPTPRSFPSPTTPQLAKELAPLPGNAAGRRRCSGAYLDRRFDRREAHHRLPGRAEPGGCSRTSHYLIRLEPGVQTPRGDAGKAPAARAATRRWLLVQLLRHLGLAARFVSGYLIQLTADVKSLDGPSGPERDFTDLHAWCEVYLPGAGWIGLDPTSGLLAGEGHIPLACTPSRRAPRPITGVVEKCRGRASTHHMAVQRICEAPRVTKPYTDEQWDAIDALGHASRRRPAPRDVRLTHGRRADLRVHRRPGRRRVEHGRARADQARLGGDACCDACAPLRAEAACCTTARASGIPASRCRAGRSAATGARTASRSGTNPELIADEARTTAYTATQAAAFLQRARASKLGVDREARRSRLRGRLVLPLARAPAADQRRSVRCASSTIRTSATACAKVFEQGLDKAVSATRCRSPR